MESYGLQDFRSARVTKFNNTTITILSILVLVLYLHDSSTIFLFVYRRPLCNERFRTNSHRRGRESYFPANKTETVIDEVFKADLKKIMRMVNKSRLLKSILKWIDFKSVSEFLIRNFIRNTESITLITLISYNKTVETNLFNGTDDYEDFEENIRIICKRGRWVQ